MTDDLKGKRFLRVGNLAHRWDCGTTRIYDLVSKGYLKAWHPERKTGCKGLMIDVGSIVKVEEEGYVDIE